MMIQLPTGKHFNDWLIDIARSNPTLNVPTPMKKTEWWDSANQLIALNSNTLSSVCLPSRTQFPKKEDWRRWAFFLITAL